MIACFYFLPSFCFMFFLFCGFYLYLLPSLFSFYFFLWFLLQASFCSSFVCQTVFSYSSYSSYFFNLFVSIFLTQIAACGVAKLDSLLMKLKPVAAATTILKSKLWKNLKVLVFKCLTNLVIENHNTISALFMIFYYLSNKTYCNVKICYDFSDYLLHDKTGYFCCWNQFVVEKLYIYIYIYVCFSYL